MRYSFNRAHKLAVHEVAVDLHRHRGIVDANTLAKSRPSEKALIILGSRGIPAAHGGFETFAEKLALYMAEEGWTVTVYCQREAVPGSQTDGAVEVDWWCGVRRVSIAVRGCGPVSTVLFDWRCVRHARTLPGVRLVLGYNTACFLPILRAHGHPIITNMDGIEWKRSKWPLPVKFWFFLSERLACRVSTALVADHPEIHNHLATRCSRRKITMIPYGADRVDHASAAALDPYGLVPDRYVVSICRIEPENSVLELVRAFSRAERPFVMVCVGYFSPGTNAYHKRIRDAASHQVKFPGGIYDKETMAAIRKHALAYLHGHTVGGTNPSLVEALGAGNAVVAHRNKYNQWTAGSGQYYFDTEDECASIFDRLTDGGSELQLARKASLERHAARFSWKEILDAYKSLCLRFHRAYATVALVFATGLGASLVQPSPARAEYLLAAGDKLEMTVSGFPARRLTVNADGQVAVFQIGNVSLAGLSLSAAQTKLRDEYRARGVFQNADILLEVAEYRPFFIDGDVAKPGAYAYHPNMTVREAIALAGGLETTRIHLGENPFLRSADLRHEYQTIAVEKLRIDLRYLSVNAELDGKSDVRFDAVETNQLVPAEIFKKLVELEKQQFVQRRATYNGEIAALEASIREAEENLKAMSAQMTAERSAAKHEEQQVSQTRDNVARGASPQMRIAEAERNFINAESRYLAALGQVWVATRSVSDLKRQLARLKENHRTSLFREAEDIAVTQEKLASQAQTISQKLSLVGRARSSFHLQAEGDAKAAIFRKERGVVVQSNVSLDADVKASDLIEIYLQDAGAPNLRAALPASPD